MISWYEEIVLIALLFRKHERKIATFSLKSKVNIWWEDLNNVKGIHEEYFNWHKFERLF